MKTFGERLRELRTEKNISLEKLGNKIGVTRGAVSHWEKDWSEPNYETLVSIAKALGTTPNYLLGFDSNDANSTTPQGNYITKYLGCSKVNPQTSVCFVKSGCLVKNTQDGTLQICTKCYEFTTP